MSIQNIENDHTLVDTPFVTFGAEDHVGIQPHSDNPMVISITTSRLSIVRVLVDGGSSPKVIYWKCYRELDLIEELLKIFLGTLVGFSGEQVKVRGYIDLHTTFGEGVSL